MKRTLGWLLLAWMLGGMALQHPAPADDLALARAAQAHLEWRRALAWYADAAALEPADAAPWLGMAQIRFGQGKLDLAAQAIIAAGQRAPRDAAIWQLAGRIAQARGSTAEAAVDWRHALSLAPTFLAVADDLARLDLAAGQPATALQDLALATGTSPALQADRAIAALHVGTFPQAQTVPASLSMDATFAAYRRVAAFRHDSPAGEVALGYADLANDFPLLAEQPLQAAIQRNPSDGPAYLYLAWARWTLGDISGARTALQHVERPGTLDEMVIGLQALLRAQKGDAAGALQQLDAWGAHHALSPALWGIQAQIAWQAGDIAQEEAARWHLATTLALPDRSAAVLALADFYERTRLGRDDGHAAWTFAQLRLPATNNPQAADLLAQWDWQSGDIAGALAWAQHAVALKPEFVAAHVHLAAWEAQLGDTTAASLEAGRVADLTGG